MNARISDSNGEIAKLFFHKRCLHPGSSIMGSVDFSSASRICCQFLVSLISKETALPNSAESIEHRTTQEAKLENCIGTEMVSFAVQVPVNAIPTFANVQVHYEWILKFDFVLSNTLKLQNIGQEFWKAPTRLKAKTTTWETPIFLYQA
jgi:hypothetical protein